MVYNHPSTLLLQRRTAVGSEQAVATGSLTVESCLWYALCTRSRHEKLVHQGLQGKGVESFLPLQEVFSQWKDRRKRVEKPLFPGYLFVRVPRSELHEVVVTRGAAYVLGNGDVPIPVPDEQVQAIRRMVEAPQAVIQWPWLQKGRRVRVKVGPLAGLETYIVERKKTRNCYLVITVDLMGRSVAVEIDPRCVEVIS